ncbi:MAG: Xaa-Pro peptidase family protein [Bryobacteraceae bacterium]|nr:Xaa-Pro peptidase family protein [Bryobacteraceae bacterium]
MRVSEIQEALREAGLDGWLFFDHHLRDPLGYRVLGFTPPRTPSRRWYYLVPAHGEPRKLVHSIESGMIDALPGRKHVYAGWQTLTDGLRELLAGCQKVAMQYSPHCAILTISMVDAGTLEQVRALGVEVVTSADLLQQFEARWSEQQFAGHLEAGRRVDAIRRAAFKSIRAGMTEFAVQQWIRQAFARENLVTDHGPIVAVNSNASDPHYEPTAERTAIINPGDVVLIDLWAKLDHPGSVYYDVTWTGYYGAVPPDRVQNVFQVVTEARRQASALAAPGLQGYQIDDAARGVIREAGYGDYFFHRTGHSIGEDVHGSGANMDNLETHDTRTLIPGTCFSVEPGIYLPEFGIRSEVNVYVGPLAGQVTGEEQTELVRVG